MPLAAKQINIPWLVFFKLVHICCLIATRRTLPGLTDTISYRQSKSPSYQCAYNISVICDSAATLSSRLTHAAAFACRRSGSVAKQRTLSTALQRAYCTCSCKFEQKALVPWSDDNFTGVESWRSAWRKSSCRLRWSTLVYDRLQITGLRIRRNDILVGNSILSNKWQWNVS